MPDRKAYRLCIFADDTDKLIDGNKWPLNVTVSEWFFKNREQESAEPSSRRSRTQLEHDDRSDSASSASMHDGPEASTPEQHSRPVETSRQGREDDNSSSSDNSDSSFGIDEDHVTDNNNLADVFVDADATIKESASDELVSSQILHDGATEST
jgi:hypothetical protein